MQNAPTNVGSPDRIIRLVLAVILLWVVFYVPLPTFWVWVTSVIALILLFTGLCGFCLVYSLFKLDTSGKK